MSDFTVEGEQDLGGHKAIADAKGKTSPTSVDVYGEGLLSPQAAGVSCYILHHCYATGKSDPFYLELPKAPEWRRMCAGYRSLSSLRLQI